MNSLLLILLLALTQEDQAPRAPKFNQQYFDLAAATGGDFYFWAAGEFATANLQIPIEHEEVVLAYGSLESKRVFDIPVESGVRSLEVFAGVERKDLAVLLRPDGTPVREHDAGTAVQPFQRMLIVTVSSPDAGIWRLELHGRGMFCVTAHVQPGDDAPSLGKFDLKTCEPEVEGSARKVRVEFVALNGTPAGDPARCTPPPAPFRVAVAGVDANGKPFRRIERASRQK